LLCVVRDEDHHHASNAGGGNALSDEQPGAAQNMIQDCGEKIPEIGSAADHRRRATPSALAAM